MESEKAVESVLPEKVSTGIVASSVPNRWLVFSSSCAHRAGESKFAVRMRTALISRGSVPAGHTGAKELRSVQLSSASRTSKVPCSAGCITESSLPPLYVHP